MNPLSLLLISLASLAAAAPISPPPPGWSEAPMPKDILRDTASMRSSLLGHAKLTGAESFRDAVGHIGHFGRRPKLGHSMVGIVENAEKGLESGAEDEAAGEEEEL